MTRPNIVELLETRIAPSTLIISDSALLGGAEGAGTPAPLSPTISADGKSATFIDVDGDVFTVTTTKGVFTSGNFVYVGDSETGQGYLQKIDVSLESFGLQFRGSKIKVTVDQVVGDGFADVGFIDAWGVDLKQVVVPGDLIRIDVGDANARTPALGLLQADQMGFRTIEEAGLSDFISTIFGKINVLQIGSLENASLLVRGSDKNPGLGSIGRATIQTVLGGDVEFSGSIATSGSIGTMTILGDLVGGSVDGTGWISAGRNIGSLTIAGNIVGGEGALSGAVSTDKGSIGSVVVGGSLLGNAGNSSGSIGAGENGKIGTVSIGDSIRGGAGEFSGSVISSGGTRLIAVQGDVEAGTAFLSGSILVFGSSKTITVGGELIGGPATSGILVEKTLSKLTLSGADGTDGHAYVIVGGPLAGGTAIGKINVLGSLNGARILAGYDPDLALSNPNVKIGTITVNGDLIATDIVVGIDGVNGVFGDGDDQIPATGVKPGFVSSIASIVVTGIAAGTEGGTDQFGILTEKIGFVQIGGAVQPLGKKTIEDLQIGSTGDYRLREIVSLV